MQTQDPRKDARDAFRRMQGGIDAVDGSATRHAIAMHLGAAEVLAEIAPRGDLSNRRP